MGHQSFVCLVRCVVLWSAFLGRSTCSGEKYLRCDQIATQAELEAALNAQTDVVVTLCPGVVSFAGGNKLGVQFSCPGPGVCEKVLRCASPRRGACVLKGNFTGRHFLLTGQESVLKFTIAGMTLEDGINPGEIDPSVTDLSAGSIRIQTRKEIVLPITSDKNFGGVALETAEITGIETDSSASVPLEAVARVDSVPTKIFFKAKDCVFQNNFAPIGGAMFVGTGKNNTISVSIEKCIFQNNSAEGFGGGAIYYISNSQSEETIQDNVLSITKSSFVQNQADARGGAVRITDNGFEPGSSTQIPTMRYFRLCISRGMRPTSASMT